MNFFHSFPNVGLGIVVQLNYQSAERLKFSSLNIGDFCTLNESDIFLVHFEHLKHKKENFNRLILWYFSCTIPGTKFWKE